MCASATAGAGHGRPDTTGGDDEVRDRAIVEARSRLRETGRAARAAAIRRAAPSPAASDHGAIRSSRIRSRIRCRSAGIVDHAITPSTTASSGSSGATAAAGTTPSRTVEASPPWPGTATARAAASWPSMIASTRRSSSSASVRAPVARARRGSSAGSASSRSRSASGSGASGRDAGRAPCAAGPSTTSPGRAPTSPKTSSASDIEPDRTTGTSGRRVATAATSVASSRIPPRSSARGGSPAPTTMPSTSRSSRSRVIASGSVVSALAPLVRQPLRPAVADEPARACAPSR